VKLRLGCVVEGYGEVQALPVLLRRLGALHDPPLAMAEPADGAQVSGDAGPMPLDGGYATGFGQTSGLL